MAGSETKLTDELAAKICEILEQGHYRETAAQLVGIHPVTMAKWMGHSREPFTSFQRAVREAEAKAEQTQLAKIINSPEPADAKWYLARKQPNKWAETRRVDVSGRLDIGSKLDSNTFKDPEAREALSTLIQHIFANGNAEPQSASPDGDE
jgi:hypothetical protein